MGEACYYHPYKIPAEPFLIGMGNNVFIGTGVTLITHSMENSMFNNINGGNLLPQVGVIEFGDNIFVGANTTIMYGVHIGNNCIIAANSVVTHDIPEGSVVAGVPAKIIGTFINRYNKFVKLDEEFKSQTKNVKGSLWAKEEEFYWKK
jgi:acetyltransferase-like isoleucine patch superfamily enzyme